VIALLAALGGCAQTCNAMYAPNTLTIAFDPALAAEGAWVVRLSDADDAEIGTCTWSPGEAADCGDSAVELTIADDTVVALSMWEPPGGPYRLRVVHVDNVVVDEEITPEVEVDEPNGKGCGEREQQTATVSPVL
jgi:hypothetical protein